MILIAYDGSAGAKAAIAQAAHLMPGHPATVLCVWEPRLAAPAPTAAAGAERLAAEGEALAHEVGVDARGAGVTSASGIAPAIVAEARRLDADAIVIGSRGPARSASVGSLQPALMRLADRPVLVVPARRAE